VGDHLLLGGDNMDLALTKSVETRLPGAGRLDAAQYGLLTQACRQAKEALLGPEPPASYTVTVMGRGRQVVGGAPHTAITPAALRERLVEVMKSWYAAPAQPWEPLVLTNPSLDLAVAWGAAHFAWLKHSGGRRIGGGIARSYYVAVEGEDQKAEGSDRKAEG